MSHYRVNYYKNLLSSDGHRFKCLQQQIDLPNVESAQKAEETAARQFESLHGLHRKPDVFCHATQLMHGVLTVCP